MTAEIKEIKTVYTALQTLYNTHLPKADPGLIDDLLMRQMCHGSGSFLWCKRPARR